MRKRKRGCLSSTRHNTLLKVATLQVVILLGLSGCTGAPRSTNGLASTTGPDTRRVTFVQWSNPHLFDAGSDRHAEGIIEEALDNQSALNWAVLETNRLVTAEHRAIDFVVITGDFGLANTKLSTLADPPSKNCDCPKRKPGHEGPIDPMSVEQAAAQVAEELRGLVVKRVFLVPGDDDLCHGDKNDMHRWAEFVYFLKKEIADQNAIREASLKQSAPQKANQKAQISLQVDAPAGPDVVDLTYSASSLYYDLKDSRILSLLKDHPPEARPNEPPTINGIRILGLNSAYFGHANDHQKQATAPAIAADFESLKNQIKPGFSYLIFTHIPGVNATVIGNKSKLRQIAGQPTVGSSEPEEDNQNSGWVLDSNLKKTWQSEILAKTEVVGVFGGHFQTAKRESYPQNFETSKPGAGPTATKQWVSPPLAVEDQWSLPPEKTARGFLLVTVTGNGVVRVSPQDGENVASSPIWFSASDQKAVMTGDDKLAEARASELDGKWSDAAKSYKDALDSNAIDSRTRESALVGYVHARNEMRSWWWNSTLANWLYMHGVPALVTSALVFGLLLLYGFLRWVRAFGFATKIIQILVVPRFRGRAVIAKTAQMTPNAPSDEFGAQILAAGEEIRTRLLQEQESWAARHITLLAPASSSFNSLVNSIPKVGNTDVSSWAKFVAALFQTFQWSVDSGLAVFQPNSCVGTTSPTAPPPNNGTLPQGGELSAYAVLQWGWFVKNSWRRSTGIVSDRADLRDLARTLAELILGEAFV